MTVWFVVFVLLLAMTGGMRLIELLVSQRRLREDRDRLIAEPWLFPWMAVLHAGLVVAPLAEVVLLERPVSVAVGAVALAVFALATLLRIWTLRTIGRSWNVKVVRPERVVTTGPYRFIRHPNYLVVILEIAALPAIHGAWISMVALTLVNAGVLFVRIRTEERVLRADPDWWNAMKDRARLIPGVF